MKIFIGSSRESLDLVREIQVWLEEHDHEPIPWDKPGLFPPGEQTFKVLMEISREVEAAILLFGSDDKVWYRGDSVTQPRDNVLIEYGLFGGALGLPKAIVCRDGDAKHPADLAGLTYIDLSEERRHRGKLELSIWARNLTSGKIDPAVLQFQAKVQSLRIEKEQLEEDLRFEVDKSRDLSRILKQSGVLDLTEIDIDKDGHWKLLFDSGYFSSSANLLARATRNPIGLRKLLIEAGAESVANKIAWHSPSDPQHQALERGAQRTEFLSKKALRLFRRQNDSGLYVQFMKGVPATLSALLDEQAIEAIARRGQEQDMR